MARKRLSMRQIKEILRRRDVDFEFISDEPGTSFIMFAEDSAGSNLHFQCVKTVLWADVVRECTNAIGGAITPPIEHEPDAGEPWVPGWINATGRRTMSNLGIGKRITSIIKRNRRRVGDMKLI
jgi:hypothetical protein